MYYSVPKEKNPLNYIIFALVFIVGTGFLFLSYYTDTLGKFSQFIAQDQTGSAVLVQLEYDSYGSVCSPNINNGNSRILVVESDSQGCEEGASGGDKQIYLKFDASQVSKDFTKATMFLKVENSDQSGEFDIYSIELAWKELEVRWNGPQEGIYWYGAGLSTKDLSTFSSSFKVNSLDEYVTVDVTKHVRYWVEQNKNYGLVIKSSEGSLEFLSKESDEPAFILVK